MTSIKPSERLLKYPPMTRQDLNQSQLGSFKFTPVDNLRELPNNPLPSKFLQDQLAESFARALAHDAARRQKAISQGGKPSLSSKEASVPDANFFNEQFKPDLSDSRLKLGSAALRSAVAGATSPTKTDRPSADRLSSHNSNLASSTQTSVYNHSSLVMDPMASTFTPSSFLYNPGLEAPDATTSSSYHPDSAAISQSLCLALANEQQAHNATRLALEEESQRCLQLEDQIETHQQTIKRLNTTVNSLGAIIKHSVSKENEVHHTDGNEKGTAESDQEEVSLKEFYRDHSRLRKDRESEKTEVGEEVKDMERQYPGGEEQRDLACIVAVAETVVDEVQLFNLELLKSPKFGPGPSPESALRNTLRKHFVIADTSVETTAKTPTKTRVNANKLIDLSPESPEDSNEITARDNPRPQETPSGKKDWNTLLTAETPVLELPASIVAKYSRKPTVEAADISNQTNNQGSACELDTTKTTVAVPNGCGMNSEGVESREVARGTIADTTVRRITVKIPENFDGQPKWLVNKDNPLFDTEDEMWQVCARALSGWADNSPFPAFPVRYLPEQAVGSSNAYRTVMVDEIPLGSTLKDVLTIVRGGTIESVLLVGPIGRVNQYMTAQVIFVHESAADGMCKRQENAPFIINGSAVRTWKPMDPTYPSNRQVAEAIFGVEEATRIVLIGNIEETEFAKIQPKLRRINLDRFVIEYSVTEDGFGSIEFPNVNMALKATAELKRDRDFADAIFNYDDDYTRESY